MNGWAMVKKTAAGATHKGNFAFAFPGREA